MLISFEHVSTDGGLSDLNLKIPVSGCTVIDDQAEAQSPHILRVLAGLENITDGLLKIDGAPSDEFFGRRPLHQVFGYVFDEGIMLSNLSLRENIMLPLHRFGKDMSGEDVQSRLDGWLRIFGLDIDLARRPSEVNAARLKFLSYVRALMLEPDILIIDDPYYVLNKKERTVMLSVLRELRTEKAMLIASTDDDFTSGFAEHTIELGEISTTNLTRGSAKA